MNKLIDILEGKRGYLASGSTTNDEIKSAEKQLSLEFSDEYREYLSRCGEVSFFGHELTGLTKSKRLNVVDVTNEEKGLNEHIPEGYYVVEQANIDGIVIWQSRDGSIYKSHPKKDPEFIFSSLAEYVSNI